MSFAIARLLSWIFNPVTLLVFVPFFLALKATDNIASALWWMGYTVLILSIFTGFLFLARQKHIFTDLDVSHKEQRPLLFTICVLFCFIYIAGVLLLRGPFILLAVGVGIIMGIIAISLVNIKIKASIHTATVSAIVFALVMVYGGFYSVLLLAIPLMSWARIKIKRHTMSEAIVGAIMGSLLSLMIYAILRIFGHHA